MKIIALIISIIINGFTAFESSNNNAFLSGLSSSVVASKRHPAAFLINPAISAQPDNNFLGISYFRPFSLSNLNFAEIIACTNFQNFGTGIRITSFGSKAYLENDVSLSLSRSFFGKKFSGGFNFHWYHISITNYKNSNSFGLDFGIQYEFNPNISTGFAIKNINQPKINKYDREIPVITTLGLAIKLNDKIFSHLAIQKESWFAPTFLFGMNFSVNHFLSVQSGFTTYPAHPSLGCQLTKSVISIYYSFRFHTILGGTHYWGISFH